VSIKSKAAVAYQPRRPMEIEMIEVETPQEGEVLVEIKATGLCHSDMHLLTGDVTLLSGFPGIPGHEAAGIVVEVGPGVKTLKPGDHVVPFIAQCSQCGSCLSGKTNLCDAQIMDFQTVSRFIVRSGARAYPFSGLGTFTNFSVIREIALVKVRHDVPFDQLCYLGCGATTGLGAVLFSANVTPGSSVIVFGLGGIGLNVVQGARFAGATSIIAVDTNPGKAEIARKMGATEVINPKLIDGDLAGHLREITKGGADFTFEAVGNTQLMRTAFDSARYGWGVCTIIGMAPDNDLLAFPPISLIMGRKLQGSVMGGVKGRAQIPRLADWVMDGRIDLASLITAKFAIEDINEGYELMKRGEGIRSVVTFP
jgi:S-(hydroxymethyl)glutathione dehydrogenase/alcohol dehydrogenase